MNAKRKIFIVLGAFGFFIWLSSTWQLSSQQAVAPADTGRLQVQKDPLAELTPENRALFDALRESARQGHDADVLTNGKKLLPALQTGTPLAEFVTQLTANAATETGDTSYALTLIKPLVDTHPNDWRASTLLARLYAESGEKDLRDQQIKKVIALHKQTSDAYFAKLHIFPIQKVKLHTGYAVFLYPFEPLAPHNSYLVAMIYTNEDKVDYRIELESDTVDQAFFKAKKPGERRFSIDTFRETKNGESQALHGFIDGVFDYDTMRDSILKIANDEESPRK